MARPGEKNISAFIEPKVSEDFKSQCEERGMVKYKAIEGALRLWLSLTPAEQNTWIENKPKPVFSGEQAEKEIYADITRLSDLVLSISAKIERSEQARKKKPSSRQQRAGG